MTHLFRKGDGQPIRDAMTAAGLSGPQLAEATKEVDPDGKGISPAAVGAITGRGSSAQDRCRLRSAWLIADALDAAGADAPLQRLFSRFPMPKDSTSTVERSRSDAHEG
ncbi:XRE family transcriptional regulator [Actinacidiphila sp. DG2A-62]|uniref:XRE family transcriptional regulator n=1 Tax=Actinacidiphila sp. DG2A-62 TaxID=3108821 RepID=UPI002DB7143C|nr:XRE family transcriptional regulator [Actinacidiphila sp. DG2A-62]MEC3993955.1 XRE family transcriptional regulator [Actinacidiphila sp. DG2A-62]